MKLRNAGAQFGGAAVTHWNVALRPRCTTGPGEIVSDRPAILVIAITIAHEGEPGVTMLSWSTNVDRGVRSLTSREIFLPK